MQHVHVYFHLSLKQQNVRIFLTRKFGLQLLSPVLLIDPNVVGTGQRPKVRDLTVEHYDWICVRRDCAEISFACLEDQQ